MFFIFCLQVYFVLVSSNPLYDFNSCPITYPNYRNGEQLLIQSNNNNPYLQNLLVQNQLTPNKPSSKLQQQLLNLLIPNYQYNFQNGVDFTKQNSEPFESQKVINNYILVPEEYFANDGNGHSKDKDRKVESHLKNNRRRKNKKHRQSTINTYTGTENVNNRETTELKPENITKDEIRSTKSKRKKSKKNRERNKIKSVDPEELEEERFTENRKRSKHVNSIKTSLDENNVNKSAPVPISKKSEPEFSKVSILESKPNKDETGFNDFHVCFDINEDCTDLDCRHTRNKDVKTRNNNNRHNKPHSKPPPDLTNNFMNLMNSFTSNQQMSPNFFNSNANFPFNFDYLYQTPPTTSVKPKETSNRRRSRKRKQPTSRQTNSNKRVKELKTTTESCAQVVELVPETTEIDISTMAAITTENVEKLKSIPIVEKPQNVFQDELNSDNYKPDIEKPITIDDETVHKEEIENDRNIMLFENYNDIMDEYYPDFTSDKSYISSKEDYELNNDRYFYYYGDNAELNRDRRKYEHQKENQIHHNRKVNWSKDINEINVLNTPDKDQNGHKYDNPRKSETSLEKKQLFFPSAIEFPGFKTEMINKEEYFAKEGEYEKDVNILARNKMPSYSDIKESNHGNEYHNNVEMVFANSKVVKYGTLEHEMTTKLPQPEYQNKNKKDISDGSKTIVIFAKSLDYS